jgi:hypothetical protein
MKGKKAILMLGMPVGFALAGALVYMQVAGASAAPPKVPDPSPGQSGIMLALDEKVVNLTPGGAYKYLKIGITVELRPEKGDFYALKGEARKVVEDEALKVWETSTPLRLDGLRGSGGGRAGGRRAVPAAGVDHALAPNDLPRSAHLPRPAARVRCLPRCRAVPLLRHRGDGPGPGRPPGAGSTRRRGRCRARRRARR